MGGIPNQLSFYVYIMANPAGITYVGMTNDILRRVSEHKRGVLAGFTRTHGTKKLAYYEEFQYVEDAIAREKQIKGWRKEKKRALIQEFNPRWDDLSVGWFEE
jgi:putative endonuclease